MIVTKQRKLVLLLIQMLRHSLPIYNEICTCFHNYNNYDAQVLCGIKTLQHTLVI